MFPAVLPLANAPVRHSLESSSTWLPPAATQRPSVIIGRSRPLLHGPQTASGGSPKLPRRRTQGGTVILFLDMIAIEFPGFGSTHSRERARVVAMLSYTALSSGLCPRRAVATEIGVPLDAHAGRRVKSTTLDRWLEETRELGYLKPYGPAKHTPRRWPWEGWPEGRPPAR